MKKFRSIIYAFLVFNISKVQAGTWLTIEDDGREAVEPEFIINLGNDGGLGATFPSGLIKTSNTKSTSAKCCPTCNCGSITAIAEYKITTHYYYAKTRTTWHPPDNPPYMNGTAAITSQTQSEVQSHEEFRRNIRLLLADKLNTIASQESAKITTNKYSDANKAKQAAETVAGKLIQNLVSSYNSKINEYQTALGSMEPADYGTGVWLVHLNPTYRALVTSSIQNANTGISAPKDGGTSDCQ